MALLVCVKSLVQRDAYYPAPIESLGSQHEENNVLYSIPHDGPSNYRGMQ
jgi:hypothetical protein